MNSIEKLICIKILKKALSCVEDDDRFKISVNLFKEFLASDEEKYSDNVINELCELKFFRRCAVAAPIINNDSKVLIYTQNDFEQAGQYVDIIVSKQNIENKIEELSK